MKNQGVPIASEGLPFLLVLSIATAAVLVGGWGWLAVPLAAATVYVAYFFRNPERLPPVGSTMVCSPADGKVIHCGVVIESEFLHGPMHKVSIFMSLMDVHINRVPVDGTVKDMKYHKGRFMAAFEDAASEENERNAMLIETARGQKVVVVQVAGLVARRIVSYPTVGAFVLKGQRMGLIRFGSRCDIYFAQDTDIAVKVGDRVLGGETILARLKDVGAS